MKPVGGLKKIILSSFSSFVTILCFAFVLWQSIQCVTKYTEKDQGTKLSIENTAHLPFPAITICGYPVYNLAEIKKCGNRYILMDF